MKATMVVVVGVIEVVPVLVGGGSGVNKIWVPWFSTLQATKTLFKPYVSFYLRDENCCERNSRR